MKAEFKAMIDPPDVNREWAICPDKSVAKGQCETFEKTDLTFKGANEQNFAGRMQVVFGGIPIGTVHNY